MRYIGKEFLPHLINFILSLNIPLKFIISTFQFGNRLLQCIGKLIDILSKLCDLRPALSSILRIKIQVDHSF